MSLLKESKEYLRESPRILVTGANGLVGSRFCELCSEYESIFSTKREELDILNKDAIRQWVEEKKPEVLINFAALTDVNKIEEERAEGEKNRAFIVNAIGPRNLAEVCRENKIFLIQISTDFVFPGFPPNEGPYLENAKTAQAPEEISWYGWTKLMGERAIQEVGGDFAIVRISYPFRASFKELDFARKILHRYDKGELYPMFIDQLITPTFIDELVEALKKIAETRVSGIYHVASRELTTPFAFTSYLIHEFRGVKRVVEAGWMSKYYEDYPKAVLRPQRGGFNTSATQERLGMKFMSWDEAIKELYRQNPYL